MSDLVKVDSRSIGKAMLEAGHDAFWIQFRTDNCRLDDFGQALNMANDPDGICGEGGFRTPHGIVFLVSDPGGHGEFEGWTATLAANLESLGATGILEGAKAAASLGAWSTDDPTSAAFVAWAQDLDAVADDEHRRGNWHVPADATGKVIEHASAWTASGGERSVVSLGTFPLAVSSEADVASLMRLSLMHNHSTASVRYAPGLQRGRMANLGPGGAVVMQEIGADVPWPQRLEAVHEALTALPMQFLDLAFIRPSPGWTHSWTQIDMRQKLPGLREFDVRYNRHLLFQYTPDAHGIQILTGQHLTRSRDLSSWRTRDLGHDRYLVEAEDLTPWYSTPLPDKEVVDQARHDFGDMILTKEAIAANPPPWRPAA